MGLPDGLTEAEAADYLTTIRGPYETRTRVEVLDNDRRLLSTLRANVIGGQIDGKRITLDPLHTGGDDQQVGISRYARSVVLYDPNHRVALDSGSPDDGALYLDRSIRIVKSIRGRLRWYDVPLITGPISDLNRVGSLITLEAEGCEAFGMGAAFTPGTIKTPKTKVAAFRELMYATGEVDAWMDVPSSKEKLARAITIARDTRRWDKAFALMASMNRLCFYDASSRLRTPVASTKPVITIDDGPDGLLLEEIEVNHSLDNFFNSWWQQTTSAKGKDVEATEVLPASHPLAPKKIGRGGKARHRMGTESNNDHRTVAKADARAKKNLKHHSIASDVKLNCRPIWHLDPFDWAALEREGLQTTFPVNEFSLPVVGAMMTVGYRKNLPNPNVKKIRGR